MRHLFDDSDASLDALLQFGWALFTYYRQQLCIDTYPRIEHLLTPLGQHVLGNIEERRGILVFKNLKIDKNSERVKCTKVNC